MQNDKSNFKNQFDQRLVSFSISILKFSQKNKQDQFLNPVFIQLIRSSTSVGANVFEAKSASSKREYTHYFQIALKSANETKYWLTILGKSSTSLTQEARSLYKEADEISRIIASSILTLKGKKSI